MTTDQLITEFETFQGELKSFLLRMTASVQDAEDIVQEALLRGYRGIQRFRGDCPLRIWLSRIVVRVAINHHRSAARRLKRWVFFSDVEMEREDGSHHEFDPPDQSGSIPRERTAR